jgi:thiol-disulfide isomerase/thioredoxin
MRTLIVALLLLATTALPAAGLEGTPATQFTLSTPHGEPVTLPEQRDGVDVYFFWASWCPFCSEIKPYLQALVDEHGDRVRVYAISFREHEGVNPSDYLRGLDFRLLLEGERIADDYGAWVLPGIFVVDGDGHIGFSLYENRMPNPPGYENLPASEQAMIRAPWWGQRIREAVEAAL